jgi:hypothetical protein
MLAESPVMRRFAAISKVLLHNSIARDMRIILPVEPGSVLDDDCTEIAFISFRDKENRQDAKERRVKPKIDSETVSQL